MHWAKFCWNWPNGSAEKDFKIFLFCNELLLEKVGALHLNILKNPLHLQVICAKFSWYWPSGYGKKDFLKSSMYFSQFRTYHSLERHDPSFEQTWMPFTQGCIFASFCDGWYRRRRFFLILSMYFRYFVNISTLWKRWALHWTILNPLYPRMICAKFSWN